MTPAPANAQLNVGFLTILQESSGYLGGYLVTNSWGRPLEFRLSSAVQPNRAQQLLYADTLQPYIFGDLIGKTLIEKTTTPAGLVITDRRPALALRQTLSTPIGWLTSDSATPAGSPTPLQVRSLGNGSTVYCHGKFAGDVEAIGQMLEQINGCIELAEPFTRIRDAIAEARKTGAANRN